ncbi:MAG: MFS transporter [Negativicutes bacterium]|nr:MFS transporter [Negativicutes bacterium]
MEENWQRNLYILWIGTFIAGTSFSLVSPFLPLLLQEIGQESNVEFWSGLIFSASFITSSIMSPIWGSLADRFGKKPMIIRSGLGIALTYFMMFFATQPWHLLVCRLLNGLLSGFIPSAISLVATNTPEHRVGRSLSLISTASNAGSVIGPLFGGLLAAAFGMRQTMLIGGGTLLLATVVVIFGVQEKILKTEKPRSNILQDLKEASYNRSLMAMLITQTMITLSLMIIQPVLTLFIGQLGVGENVATYSGIIFSLAGIASVIAAPIWARYGEKIGFRNTLSYSLVGVAMMNLLQIFAHNVYVFAAMRFAYGLFLAGVVPAVNAIIAASVPLEFRGRAFGISNSFNGFGGALGPLIGGAIGTWLGIRFVFLFAAVSIVVNLIWIRLVFKKGVENSTATPG